MSSTALVAYRYSEAIVAGKIMEARGDIFVASQMLGMTARKLDQNIRASENLQRIYMAIKQTQTRTDYDTMSAAQVEQDVQRRLALYRVDGLDALHDIATMPISDNSAQNQVKLAAAARLAGTQEQNSTGSEIDATLRALNESYHAEAPRIRVTRERMTFETIPPERVVNPE